MSGPMVAGGAVSRREAVGLLVAGVAAPLLPARVAAAARADAIVALAAGKMDAALLKTDGRRLSRSADGGRSWRELNPPLRPHARIQSISLSAGDPAAIYLAGPGVGVLHSTDAGAGWTSISRGLPSGVTAVAAHASQRGTVYAHVPSHGVYRSEDAGARWRLMDAGPRGGITQFVHSDLPGSMQTGWLFVAGPKGVRLSMDCFCGWRNGGDLTAPAHVIAYDPANPRRVIAAAGAGLYESTDAGQAWIPLTPPGAPVAALAVGLAGHLYAASADHVYRQTAEGWEATDA